MALSKPISPSVAVAIEYQLDGHNSQSKEIAALNSDNIQRRPTANATTVCFGTLQEAFSQNITLQQLFAGFDCTAKAPDRTYFDWIASQFSYVFGKVSADVVRILILVKAGGLAWGVVNQLFANLALPANQVDPINQIPLLPVVNGVLQPFDAGQPAAPIDRSKLQAATLLVLQAVGWFLDNYVSDELEKGLENISNAIINQIKDGTSQMSIISVINSTRFPFTVTETAAYKGQIVTTFFRLEGKEAVQEGSFAYIGIFSSDSTFTAGSASAITLMSTGSTATTQDKFIIAAAAPIIGKRTTLISINDPNETALDLADKNDTSGQGKVHDEGDGLAFHLWADVEQNAINNYCHVRVFITEKST